MKVHSVILSLLAFGNVAWPMPHAGYEKGVEMDIPGYAIDSNHLSPHEAGVALSRLEKRLPPGCVAVGEVVKRIGTSATIITSVNTISGVAKRICEKEGYERCVRYIGYIQDGFNSIFAIVAAYHAGAMGVSPSGPAESDGPVRRSVSDDSFLEDFLMELEGRGFGFDGFEDLSPEDVPLAKRDGDPSLLRHVVVKGLRQAGEPHDTAISFFDNGDSVLYLPDSSVSANTTGLQKRYHGNAFKIAFTTRQKSLLTRAHQNDMSRALAVAWHIQTGIRGANEVIGLAKTDHHANFYFRVIPELNGFGLNYESVDVCGGMAGYL